MSVKSASALIESVREFVGEAPYRYESSFQLLIASEPYRELVSLGDAALPALAERLRVGDIFFNDAVLQITGVTRSSVAEEFASEQDVSAALIQMVDAGPIDFYSSAWNIIGSIGLQGEVGVNGSVDPPIVADPRQRRYNPKRIVLDATAR